MKPATITVAVSGLLLTLSIGWILGPGAPWWLTHVDGVHGLQGEQLAALDAIRGRALAVGTGLAALVAVFYTARNADTARRTFQLGQRGHDTDRYGKAAEQLGHVQAPVRLAGLYALEQLAQNTPVLRQTIVDVICAYLRMPYHDALPGDRHTRIRAAQRTARARVPAERPAGRDAREEREVRLTAQRILADHLRYREPPKTRWWRAAESDPRFWPGIRLDLTGAVLCEANFVSCRIAEAAFTGATFNGGARFGGVVFTGEAHFDTASFTGDAEFGEARFLGAAEFTSATFRGAARFGGAAFERGANFGFASFEGQAGFSEVVFGGHASFGIVNFGGNARFTGAVFQRRVRRGHVHRPVRVRRGRFPPAGDVQGRDLHQRHLVRPGHVRGAGRFRVRAWGRARTPARSIRGPPRRHSQVAARVASGDRSEWSRRAASPLTSPRTADTESRGERCFP